MDLPPFIKALPQAEIPVDPSVVETRVLAGPDALGIFFIFHQDFRTPEHHHKAQWGTVLAGEFYLTLDGETRSYDPGESYSIPEGAVHAAAGKTGTVVFDVFEEPDRYAIRREG